TLPGVGSASLAKSSPAIDWSDRVTVTGLSVDRNVIAPRYFETLGIDLVAGRDFTPADSVHSAPGAIVRRALADRLGDGAHAVGRQLTIPGDATRPAASMEVIGVAADSRYRSILDRPPLLLYVPESQNYDSIARLMVRVDGPAGEFKERLRKA